MLLYFAYGSNLSEEQMRRRCPGSALVGPGWLPGYRLAFGGHAERWQGAVATVEQVESGAVCGLLYTLTPDDLARLDGFESVPYAYVRGTVSVMRGTPFERASQPVQAETYWFAGPRPVCPPAAVYTDIIRAAYTRYAFPIPTLEDALRRARQLASAAP